MARGILAADLCQRVAIPQARHSQWVKRGLCRRIGKGGATEADAVELAVATILMEALKDIEKARRAISQLRDHFDARVWDAGLTIVWDEQLELAEWAGSDSQIGSLIRHGRAVRVLAVGGFLHDVVDSFRRLTADRLSEP